MRISSSLLSVLVGVVLLAGCGDNSQKADVKEQDVVVEADTSADEKLTRPQTKFSETPKFEQITDVKAKKKQFFDYLLTYIESENSFILAERSQVKTLKKALQSGDLSEQQMTVLAGLAKRYKLSDALSVDEQLAQLLVRVDIVPPSLALAQSANESAWGTSRFATEGNNYFGQWCFSSGCGIVPQFRPEGKIYEVTKFKDAGGSVRAYFLNLNTHRAYRQLRSVRAEARSNDKMITGVDLAVGLRSYSARGEHYVEEIQKMIIFNKLDVLDKNDV
jgi:Bax protein